MKKINKQISSIVELVISFCMLVMLIPITKINAMDESQFINEELEVAIISGDGTAENPYVVDYDKAPHFKEYIDRLDQKVLASLHGEVPLTRGVLDGVLSGTKHTGQTKGGSWVYTRNAPSLSVNGNIWMKAITYQSKVDTKAVYNLKRDTYQWNRVKEIGSTIASKPASDAYTMIVNTGIAGSTATALLRGLGKINAVFTAITFLEFFNDYLVLNRYNTAVSKGYGMIHAIYNTSYNGSWYSHTLEDTWTTADTVYEPGSYYGTGTYKSF